MLFCRNKTIVGQKEFEEPSSDLVRSSLGLLNASVEDTLKYGGDIAKAAISLMNFRNDRKYIVIDTKIHMLMPGFIPAIPGWHTDGAPRGKTGSPIAKDDPNIELQETMRSPRYHLLVTGTGALTEFVNEQVDVETVNNSKLYQYMTQQINLKLEAGLKTFFAPSKHVVEFDWWNIHRGIEAQNHEWRFLIRATETDYIIPETDLRKIIRTQQQVYVPKDFGW